MDTRDELLMRMEELVAAHLEVRQGEIEEESTWAELGADSLDRLDLSLAIEDEFNVDIPHIVGERLNTVGETVDHIWTLKGADKGRSRIWIEEATTNQHWTEMAGVRTRVFSNEHGFQFGPLPGPGHAKVWHFLARDNQDAIGTLSVLDTTGDRETHRRYGLNFGENDRVARYAQLAILAPYRRGGIFKMLIETAQNGVVRANGFEFSWLLYPAAHVHRTILTRSLGFTAETPVLRTEFGRCRVLVQKESTSGWMNPVQQVARAAQCSA
jgi:acyl carrier protein